MRSRWKLTTLGEICDAGGGEVRTGPFGAQLHESDYSEIGIPVVMPKDIADGRVDEANIARVGGAHVERLAQHKLSPGDIVYGRRGDIGRKAFVGERERGWLCGTGCLRITPGSGVTDPRYLFLALGEPSTVAAIRNRAIGATMPNLNTTILREVELCLPPLAEQRRIASILGAYDDLIDVNRRRIAVLEAMARDLYEEWFVRFHFPGQESHKVIDTPDGPLPKGWKKSTLGQNFCIVLGGTPARNKSEYWGGTIPWINSSKANELRIHSASEFITESGLEKSSTKLMPRGAVVVAITGATLGQFSTLLHPMCGNQSLVGLWDENGKRNEYLYRFVAQNISKLTQAASGGAQQHINKEIVARFKYTEPTDDILRKYIARAAPIATLIGSLLQSNAALSGARDLLLPRLISGELSVVADSRDAVKSGRRGAIAAADLTDDEASAIAQARIPPEHRYSVERA